MKTSRHTRFLTVIVAILGMLTMQLAVASYVCPGTAAGGVVVVAAMPDCQGMDAAQPVLCHAYGHGDTAKQSLDKTPSPDVPPFVAAALLLHLPKLEAGAAPEASTCPPAALARATSPPIAIRHCCFRI